MKKNKARHQLKLQTGSLKVIKTFGQTGSKTVFRGLSWRFTFAEYFFIAKPQPFDRVEFNDDFRQIGVLNHVAFLCMDPVAFGKRDLSGLIGAQFYFKKKI